METKAGTSSHVVGRYRDAGLTWVVTPWSIGPPGETYVPDASSYPNHRFA